MELSDIQALAERVQAFRNGKPNEAMTKTSLVMPFLQSMGYDIFNCNEVVAEYTADFGTKKGEKVDFAILRKNEPIMIIECKPLDAALDVEKCSQLFRYFSVCSAVKIGILTNGRKYLFFSDIEQENLMDKTPFMEFDLLDFDSRLLPEINKMTKTGWNLRTILESSADLKFVQTIKKIFNEDLNNPSENFVKLYATACFQGKFTSKIKSYFQPLVQRAIEEVVTDKINARLAAAKMSELKENIRKDMEDACLKFPQEPDSGKPGIVTTNTEVWGLLVVRTLLRNTIDPGRICMRDQKTYCGILLDDNNRKPICRLYNFEHFNWGDENIGKNAYIQIFSVPQGEKFSLRYVDDIYPLMDKLIEAVKRYEGM